MSEPYSDEVPTEPRVYWVRDRQTDCEMHGTCARGGIWYINGGKYHGDAALVDFQFGPAIPTATELAELREKAAMLDWLAQTRNDVEYCGSDLQCVIGWTPGNAGVCGDNLLDAIKDAMAKETTEQHKPSPYGWPREVGKDGE